MKKGNVSYVSLQPVTIYLILFTFCKLFSCMELTRKETLI